VKVDEQGRSNLDGLRSPPSKEPKKKGGVTFLTARFEVNHGEIHYDNLRDKLGAELPYNAARQEDGLSAVLEPRNPADTEDRLNHNLTLKFDRSSATYKGRSLGDVGSSATAVVVFDEANKADQRVDDLVLKFTSNAMTATASGNVSSFSPLKYSFPDVQVN